MAKDGLFFQKAAIVHPKHNVPSNAIILQCIIAVVLTLSGTFEQLLTYMGFALGIFPLLSVFGVFILRKKNLPGIKLPGYPYVQLIYILTGVVILALSFLERPKESSIAILTVLIGIPAYYLFKNGKRNKEL